MELRFFEQPNLPTLAWCAHFQKGGNEVNVFHGSGVETRKHCFFEAAWNGPYEDFDPVNTSILCGTGAAVQGDSIFFTASTDRFIPIFSIQKHNQLFVSNSPVFVMAVAQETPDDDYPFYPYRLLHIKRMGLHCLDGHLPLQSGMHMDIHFSAIIQVDHDGQLHFRTHPPGEQPRDYASYYRVLLAGLKSVLDNAADIRRKNPRVPISAISRGYDSTAATVLAAQAGCKTSYSFIDHGRTPPSIDSGKDNAVLLGMEHREYSRWYYLDLPGMPELEFALWGLAMSTPLLALQEELKNKVLISGHFGDVLSEQYILNSDNLALQNTKLPAGLGETEFRLRVGYLTFAPATISARHNRSLAAIIQSAEMKPWSVGGEYDRPLLRRIAEEAGLPRASFGQKKTGGGHSHFGIKSVLSPGSLKDYERFLAERDKRVSFLSLFVWKLMVNLRYLSWDIFCVKSKPHHRWKPWRRYIHFLFGNAPARLPWKFLFCFQWSFDRLKSRYQLVDTPDNK